MQSTLRSQIDGDLNEEIISFSEIRTNDHQAEIICSDCGKVYFTDQETAAKFRRSLELSLDNPFVCDDCRFEYDELAREPR